MSILIFQKRGEQGFDDERKRATRLLKELGVTKEKAKSILDEYFTEQEKTLKNPNSKSHQKSKEERYKRLEEFIK